MSRSLAFYLRISHEDSDLQDESNSIVNQKKLLYNYVSQNLDLQQYSIIEYIDDGFSGKNFERPGVQKLFDDIRQNKIYGIVVKDLSRFGRDYITVGNYIEKIFILLDIRFIALNDHYDSYCVKQVNSNIGITFKNLIYDYYSVDNSIKIKNDLFKKRERGQYLCTIAPYGYKKSEITRNHLIIDEETANIVKLIFNLYLKFKVKAEVARYLNFNKIPTPQQYAETKGILFKWKYKSVKGWSGSIVSKILSNQVYLGNLVYHKKEVLEVGSKIEKTVSKSDWLVIENTHEAIISKEVFDEVQQIISNRIQPREDKTMLDKTIYCEGEKRKRGSANSPIKGLVKCGGCKHTLTRRNRRIVSYYCRYYYENKYPTCCNYNIKETELEEFIFYEIKAHIKLVADLKCLYNSKKAYNEKSIKQINQEIASISKKIKYLKSNNFDIYERYQNNKISKDCFLSMKESNTKEICRLESKLSSYQNNEMKVEINEPSIFSIFDNIVEVKDLSRDIVEKLIDLIYVYPEKKIEIVFRYKDEIQNLINLNQNIL